MAKFYFSSLALVALLGATAPGAEELVSGGNFDDLDAWSPARVPSGAQREIIQENSPFTEVYPSNGKCVKLVDAPAAHTRFLEQPLVSSEGKYVWSFDFKILGSDNTEQNPGFIVFLGAGKTSHTNFRLGQDGTLNISIGKSRETSWTTQRGWLMPDVWYHFSCEIDLAGRTLTGSLASESGDVDTFDRVFPEDTEMPDGTTMDRSFFDSIKVGSNSGTSSISTPTLFDNLSVRKVAP